MREHLSRISKVQSLPLRFADLPNLFTAKDLEWLELQARACDAWA